ncbi:serine/threonine-protein kinase [Nocardia macrotermitis]|uniref:non-specific serine/threonine protein kinase n=1 Tax=Nocardia macrotermitis TaxID=2585198 RepID=A0A7K0D3D4_9NOCA|nr:serine/threonine-protein kinase [Nocardia macrotermitis]MQY20235.1 Serine/threonine-protein kinase PknD [Nocardia macrotermitis]
MRPPDIGERYDLIEEIGSGGMGAVWRGYDTVLDRPIAVKMIRLPEQPTGSEAAEIAERFRREARITAQILHHGVPQVYDALLKADLTQVYLVMELVEGATTLREYIDPHAPLPVAWVASVAAQIATALSYAHAVPVVHRDLKPDNILVTPDGTVKIIDFGIAALLTPGTPRLTKLGGWVGTCQYMAPEQGAGARPTPRADLYALGCIVYEMLSGYALFDGIDAKVLHDHAFTPPTPPRNIRADVPDELDELVMELLAKEPEQRPVDAATVYERLFPLLPPPGSPMPPSDGYLPERPDPTRIFRQPNAPLRPDRVTPAVRFPGATPATVPIDAAVLNERIEQLQKEYLELIDQGRCVQAADRLSSVIEAAVQVHGVDSRPVLDLRFDVALANLAGGEFRKAQPEFDALAPAFAKLSGFSDESALQCRRHAAECRFELGAGTEALSGMQAVLTDVRAVHSDGSMLVLEIRQALGTLLAAMGRSAEARTTLNDLYSDLVMLRSTDDDLTAEVADALERLPVEEA